MTTPTFEDIQEQYKKTIPEKIKNIQDLIVILKKTPSKENLLNLRAFVHKTIGNSAAYGYEDASNACREFEQLLLAKINSNEDFTWIDQCDVHLQKITKEFNT